MKLSVLALAAAFAVVGCASVPCPPPKLQIEPEKVPTPVACVAAADVPSAPGPLPALPDEATAALDIATMKVIEWRDYGAQVAKILRGCTQ